MLIDALSALSGVRRSNWLTQGPTTSREKVVGTPKYCIFSSREQRARRTMDLDLAGRDATPDGVGMSTPTVPATRVVVLTRVYHQLIACLHVI